MRRLPFLAALAALLSALPASASDAPSLYVVALKAPPNLSYTGKRLGQVIAAEAKKMGAFEVLGPDAVEERVGRRAYQRLVECAGDAVCLAEVELDLGADRIVGGQLLLLESAYEVRVAQVDRNSGKAIATFARVIPIASRRLVPDTAAASEALLRGEAEGTGAVFVSASTPKAEVKIDGEPAGFTPVTARLKPGKHKVEVEKAGFAKPEPRWVEVVNGDVADVDVKLTPVGPILEQEPR